MNVSEKKRWGELSERGRAASLLSDSYQGNPCLAEMLWNVLAINPRTYTTDLHSYHSPNPNQDGLGPVFGPDKVGVYARKATE